MGVNNDKEMNIENEKENSGSESSSSNMDNSITGPFINEAKELDRLFKTIIETYTLIGKDTTRFKEKSISKDELDKELDKKFSSMFKDHLLFENICDQMQIGLLNLIRALEAKPEVVESYNNFVGRRVERRKRELDDPASKKSYKNYRKK